MSLDQNGEAGRGALREGGVPGAARPGGEVGRLYASVGMPVVVLIDRDGVVRKVFEGYRRGNESQYLESVQALLREWAECLPAR